MNVDAGRFFKSVSLRLDLGHPERFAHFYPTSRSVNIIRAIAQGKPDQASIIIASYGSGKSLAAGLASLVIDNGPKIKAYTRAMAKGLERVDAPLGNFVANRARSRAQGLSIVLEGHQENLPLELAKAAKAKIKYVRVPEGRTADVVLVLKGIAERAKKQRIDRIAIVWDEFGRHLEALASSGRAEALSEVQKIAEWAARQDKPSATFSLLLHQNISHYAGNLNQAARSSWRKIEGRFGSIRYVEDSSEMYELISSVVSALRTAAPIPSAKHFKQVASRAVAAGLFKERSLQERLPKILKGAHPLLPATLYVLPRIAFRLAQNERTIFSFLRDADLSRCQSLLDLYAYFSPAMEADSGVGGSYRRWLETESALTKVTDDIEREIIAATALLGLGLSGERSLVSRKMVNCAVSANRGISQAAIERALGNLTRRKLLLYSRRNDDIAVWHGTDTDIRSRLESEIHRVAGRIDIVVFLEREHPAPYWLPTAHNVKYAIRRYYRGKYVATEALSKLPVTSSDLGLLPDEDGLVAYYLAETEQAIAAARSAARKSKHLDSRVLHVIPNEPIHLTDLISEIVAIRNLQRDTEFSSMDPFVLPELQHMIDAAQESLGLVIGRLARPDGSSSTWFVAGNPLKLKDDYDLRCKLSGIVDGLYRATPRINNELIVRRKVSRQMVNARKKLILGILERSEQECLGFDPAATTPDVALYRTVLANTGLYQCRKCNTWGWAIPEDLIPADPNLAEVWSGLEHFFQTPGRGKPLSGLIEELVGPPFGTRMGVMPILIAAGAQAFGRAIAIMRQGVYLPDILASEIEEFCNHPDEFAVDVLRLDPKLTKYLMELIVVFGGPQPVANGDLLRQLYDAIVSWKAYLPVSALSTLQVSEQARTFQKALRGDALDPVVLALQTFPNIAGGSEPAIYVAEMVASHCREIEGIVDKYTSRAIGAIYSFLALSPDAPGSVLERARDWSACLAGAQNGAMRLDRTSQAILARSLEAAEGRYSEASFARALSSILLGRSLEQWDDTSSQLFADRLRDITSGIEHAALMAKNPSHSLAPLLKRRIEYLRGVLRQVDHQGQVRNLLEKRQ